MFSSVSLHLGCWFGIETCIHYICWECILGDLSLRDRWLSSRRNTALCMWVRTGRVLVSWSGLVLPSDLHLSIVVCLGTLNDAYAEAIIEPRGLKGYLLDVTRTVFILGEPFRRVPLTEVWAMYSNQRVVDVGCHISCIALPTSTSSRTIL